MKKWYGLCMMFALAFAVSACNNNRDLGPDDEQDMTISVADMATPDLAQAPKTPDIILVPIEEVQRWYGNDEGPLCYPPNEVANIFKIFCQSRRYSEWRYGVYGGQCPGDIIIPPDLYKNVICFNYNPQQ